MDKSKILYIAKLVGLLLSLYLIFEYALPVIAPFVVGYLLAIFLDKPVTFLQVRYKINRCISTFAIVIILIGLIGGAIYGIVVGLVRIRLLFYDIFSRGVFKKLYECLEHKLFDNVIPVSYSICSMCAVIIVTIAATILICINIKEIRKAQENSIFSREINAVFDNLVTYLLVYIKAQVVIMIFTSFICIIGLNLAHNRYAFPIGVVIGFLDALPVLGSGIILVPMIVYAFVIKKYLAGVIYVITYIFCVALRHLLEPRLMGGRLGISSVEALFGLYVGVCLWGVIGLFLGPFAYLVVKKIMAT